LASVQVSTSVLPEQPPDTPGSASPSHPSPLSSLDDESHPSLDVSTAAATVAAAPSLPPAIS
jgi:hypothetical protein